MTKKQKSAKRSFISSVLVLCLCFTMFVGTTFAWYNDSVTSGRNTIVAGSLEMVLEKYIGTDGDFSKPANWETVTDQTKIFEEGTDNKLTFEPGAVQVAYVRVKNEGDLAFKYSLAAKVYEEKAGTNQDNQSFLLSTYLKFGQAQDVTAPFATREAAISAIGTAGKISDTELVPTANLQKKTTSGVIALVIYLPSETGNIANPLPNAKPEISFGLNALATQYTVESDSFSNQYDANADGTPDHTDWNLPAMSSVDTTVVSGEPTVITATISPAAEAASTTVTFPADALAADSDIELKITTTDAETASATSYAILDDGTSAVGSVDLSLYVDDVATTGSFGNAVVETKIAKNLTNVKVKYNGASGTFSTAVDATEVNADTPATTLGTANYNPATGYLSFVTDHFSEYVITCADEAYLKSKDRAYTKLTEAVAAADDDDTVILLKDITDSSFASNNTDIYLAIDKSITIDGAGHSLVTNAGRTIAVDASNINFTVKNLTSTNSATFSGGYPRGFQVNPDCTNVKFTVVNCDVSAKYYAFNFCSGTSVDVVITNSTFTGWAALNIWSNGISITGSGSRFVGNDISPKEAFGTITLDADTTEMTPLHAENMEVNLTNCTVVAHGSYQFAVQFNNNGSIGAKNNSVNLVACEITSDFAIGTADNGNVAYGIGYDRGTDNTLSFDAACTLNGRAFETDTFWSGKGLAAYAA